MADAVQHLDEARELLRVAIDLHVHTSPDVFKRESSDFEAFPASRETVLGALIRKSSTRQSGRYHRE